MSFSPLFGNGWELVFLISASSGKPYIMWKICMRRNVVKCFLPETFPASINITRLHHSTPLRYFWVYL